MLSLLASSVFKDSLGVSIIIVIMIILSPILDKKYNPKWKCWIWLLISLRLLIPVEIDMVKTKIMVPTISNVVVQTASPSNTGAVSTIASSMGNNVIASSFNIIGILSLVWLIGAIGSFTYQFMGYVYFRKQVLRWSIPVKNKIILSEFNKLYSDMEIKNRIGLLTSEKVSSPMILGLCKPILLLPHEEYTKSDIQFILKHELVHYKRHHIWFKFLILVVSSIHWFNPFIYLARHAINNDIELCCDNEVVKHGSFDDRRAYSNAILDSISLQNGKRTALSTYFSPSTKILKYRLRGVLDMRIKNKGILTFLVLMMMIFVAGEAIAFDQVPAESKVEEKTETVSTEVTKSVSVDKISSAVLSNDLSFVKDAINNGADLNKKDSSDQYPLEVVFVMNNCDMAKLLLAGGANPHLATTDGTTIYDKAMETDSKYLKEIFKSYE